MEGTSYRCKLLANGNIYCLEEEEWSKLPPQQRKIYKKLDVYDFDLTEYLYEEDLELLEENYAQEAIDMLVMMLEEETGLDKETLREEARREGDTGFQSSIKAWLQSLPEIGSGGAAALFSGRYRFQEEGKFAHIELKASMKCLPRTETSTTKTSSLSCYPAIIIKSIFVLFPQTGIGSRLWNLIVKESPYPLIVVESVMSREMWKFAVRRGCLYEQPNPEYRHPPPRLAVSPVILLLSLRVSLFYFPRQE
jgi:hypothetical protein